MYDEDARKGVVAEFFRRLNAGDTAGVLALFAPGAGIEDPMGRPVRRGRPAQRAYVEDAVRRGATVTPARPVAGQDGRQVAAPYVLAYRDGTETDVLGLFRVGPTGLIDELRACWGRTDVREGTSA